MHLTLEVSNENLRLNLGASWLVLTPAEAAALQASLTQLQPSAWLLSQATWQEATAQLNALPSLLEQAISLNKTQRQQLLSQLNLIDSLALARFSRQKGLTFSKKLNKALEKELTTKALKNEFTEELASINKSSALEVAAAKTNLITGFTNLGIKPQLNASPAPQKPAPSQEELATKGKNYLTYLAKLPANQVKVILRNLVPAEIGWLVSACKTLGVEEFNQKLAEILPPASWQKLNANCPPELTAEKLNHLLASLGLAFKQLQKHLQTKGNNHA